MNILAKRKINSYINDIVKNLTFKNNKLKLAGSASLASQRYTQIMTLIVTLKHESKQSYTMNLNVYYHTQMRYFIL